MTALFNVRMGDDLREEIGHFTTVDNVESMSAWVRECCAAVASVGGLEAFRSIMDEKGVSSLGAAHVHPPRSLALQAKQQGWRAGSCTHPSIARRMIPTGEICSICEARV